MSNSISQHIVTVAVLLLPLASAVASDESADTSRAKVVPSRSEGGNVAKARSRAERSEATKDQSVPDVDLLTAVRDGLVSVKAEGRGDGRMTLSLTNRSRRSLRVVLPPGLIAQGATGQFGGMGGMGGGMGGMGGGMGGMGGGMGGMGGGMGGMGGGMGGMGGGGGMMGGMGGMGQSSGTMPSTMGMMMLARMIMYFCGDPDSWDPRSIMIGMMGGGMGGGMMGGMMGGMGGGMGGMGGGMRSVPPSALPSALLSAGHTRHLPTRLVSISAPDADGRVSLPQKGEPLRIIGDVAKATNNPRAQKALRRLTGAMAPTSLSQLVMWRLGGLDWDTIAEISQNWANEYELTLAKDFVAHLDTLPEGETGRLLFQVDGKDAAGEPVAAEVGKILKGKTVLGLIAHVGEIAPLPGGPAVACRVRLSEKEAMVQVSSSDASARAWVNFGKFTLPVTQENGKIDVARFADGLSEGILNRLVRAQIIKGSATKDKGKLVYQLRIDNASPLVLNGLAMLGTASKDDEIPKVLPMISVSPRKSLTVPTSDEVVRNLGLKKGVKLIALDLSGL